MLFRDLRPCGAQSSEFLVTVEGSRSVGLPCERMAGMGFLETLKKLFRTGETTPAPRPSAERGERTIEDQGERTGLGETEGYEPKEPESR
jgi:hypothetical protein